MQVKTIITTTIASISIFTGIFAISSLSKVQAIAQSSTETLELESLPMHKGSDQEDQSNYTNIYLSKSEFETHQKTIRAHHNCQFVSSFHMPRVPLAPGALPSS